MIWNEASFLAARLGASGLGHVEVTGPNSLTMKVSGRCSDPVFASRTIRDFRNQGAKWMEVAKGEGREPIFQDVEARCRRCENCLRERARSWTARAIAECNASARTWFGTLTCGPDVQCRTLMRARALAFETLAGDYDAMPYGEQFVRRVDVLGPDLQRYIKRVRKASGAKLRYLLVAERHQSGDPHFHMLVHEVSEETPVRERTLSGQWVLGFSQWRLSDPSAAWYVCKYLSKTLAARVRASHGYGTPPLVIAGNSLREKMTQGEEAMLLSGTNK